MFFHLFSSCLYSGAVKTEEEDHEHRTSADSSEGEATVCPGREPCPAGKTTRGGGGRGQGMMQLGPGWEGVKSR